MEVLLWLAPAGVVTLLAMAWAGWQGRREGRVLDRDEAVRRLGAALERPAPRIRPAPTGAARADRSTSVAVRRPAPQAPQAPARPPAPEVRPTAAPDEERRSA